ncbi:hypothetical protein [Paenibacillus sp. XY044]|nr:hypothetical protein [Paenibacillus sp. XY044]
MNWIRKQQQIIKLQAAVTKELSGYESEQDKVIAERLSKLTAGFTV